MKWIRILLLVLFAISVHAATNVVIRMHWEYKLPITNGVQFVIRHAPVGTNVTQLGWPVYTNCNATNIVFVADPWIWRGVTVTNSITGEESQWGITNVSMEYTNGISN